MGPWRELPAKDLEIYDNDNGEFIFSTGMVYLSRDPFGLTIEIPKTSGCPAR
jgi:hypothetical protein